MATQLNLERKEVLLSQVILDLNSGLTKWRKDDIGFGSLEKKYNLLPQEAIDLFSHPKIRNVETKSPAFIIIDDIYEEIITSCLIETPKQEVVKTETPTVNTTKVIIQEPNKKLQAFI